MVNDNRISTGARVSIIVPVFNKEKYLRDCIESLRSQTYRDIEIILIDDGSVDGSWEIINKYSRLDVRIIALHQDNAGVCVARNNGLNHVSGKWISFVDADDALPTNSIETLVAHADKHNADLVIGNFTRVQGTDEFFVHEYDDDFINHNILTRIDAGRTWGQLYKSEIIREHQIRFIDGLAYSEDYVFLTNYCLYIKSLEYISDSVYYYRINSDSVTYHPDIIKNAYHQLWAAESTYRLLDLHPEVSSFIVERTKILLKGTIESSLKKITDLCRISKLYKERFNENKRFNTFFYCYLLNRAIKLFFKLKWF